MMVGCATLPDLQPRTAQFAVQDVADTPLAHMAAAAAPAGKPGQSGFRLFFEGESAFNARIALTRRAVRSLDAQYYLVANDETGRGFLRELRDAALRGVRVRLLVDDLYAARADDLLAGLAAHPNVEVRLFNPLPVRTGSLGMRLLLSLHEFRRINHRMHNKLLIADNSFAISGGRNVGDAYFMNDAQANFVDLDVLSSGPVVRELSAVFDRYWNSERAVPIGLLIAQPPAHEARERFEAATRDATVRLGERQRDWLGNTSFLRQLRNGALTLVSAPARVLVDTPDKGLDGGATGQHATVADQTLGLLATAREEVLVMSPYFIPGDHGMQIIRGVGATEDNGRITLLTNSFGATDEPLAYAGYERYRLDLLKAGVRIFELSPTLARDSGRVAYFGLSIGRLHTKAITIDRRWLFVGSTNLDPRSARANTEVGLVIDSPLLARQVNTVFQRGTAFGAYRLRRTGGADLIEWVETDWQGHQTVHASEPHDNAWLRLKLWLLGLFVSEELL